MSRNDEKRRLRSARHSSKSGRHLDQVVWDVALHPFVFYTGVTKSELVAHTCTPGL